MLFIPGTKPYYEDEIDRNCELFQLEHEHEYEQEQKHEEEFQHKDGARCFT